MGSGCVCWPKLEGFRGGGGTFWMYGTSTFWLGLLKKIACVRSRDRWHADFIKWVYSLASPLCILSFLSYDTKCIVLTFKPPMQFSDEGCQMCSEVIRLSTGMCISCCGVSIMIQWEPAPNPAQSLCCPHATISDTSDGAASDLFSMVTTGLKVRFIIF